MAAAAAGPLNVAAGLVNVYRLGTKELLSLRYDPVLLLLILYFFSFAVYTSAKGGGLELRNASVAIVDEDRSPLSKRVSDALLAPYFIEPEEISTGEIDGAMDAGRYTFVIDIPPGFQTDVLAGRRPAVQLNVDATAMSQAGRGASYIQSIFQRELTEFGARSEAAAEPVRLVVRARFNPNLDAERFEGVMRLVNNITLLGILLTGAALIREREHGTLEHLLVMPLRPVEIMLAKVWANGLAILVAALLSLDLVVRGLLGVPIAGSVPLFATGAALYLFSVTALGIFLATLARSMPQFGLLSIMVFIVINLLSGTFTPLDSMPRVLQNVMFFSPSTHFVSFSQAVLFREAGPSVVWPQLLGIVVTGSVFFVGALARFRASVGASPT